MQRIAVISRYSDFCRSAENTCRHAYTYPDIGFLGKIVAKMVASEVPEIAKKTSKNAGMNLKTRP